MFACGQSQQSSSCGADDQPTLFYMFEHYCLQIELFFCSDTLFMFFGTSNLWNPVSSFHTLRNEGGHVAMEKLLLMDPGGSL